MEWIDGLAVARRNRYWVGPYDSPKERLWRDLFPIGRWGDHQSLPGAQLQDVLIRLELIGSDDARLRAIAHHEWGLGNKLLRRDAADDAWANAAVLAAGLRAEGLPVSAEGVQILDAVIDDPDPAGYPAHQQRLASIDPADAGCSHFLLGRARAQLERCLARMSGIRMSPDEWVAVYSVWEAAARWLMRLEGVVEPELSRALAAEATGPIRAAHSSLRWHQRGKVYSDALWCWLEANRRKLAFEGQGSDQIETRLGQLRADEEEDRVLRRRRSHHPRSPRTS